MTAFVPSIAAVGAVAPSDALASMPMPTNLQPAAKSASFGDLIAAGIDRVETKIANADALANAFALDDTIPVHQVTFALEEARLSLELMMQVRGRMLEAYQQLMGMQL